MRIIKCDYCGAEIENGGPKHIIPSDNGWAVIKGLKFSRVWETDVCPQCVPKPIETNRDDKDDR